MTGGPSGTPLAKKLGIKGGHRLGLLGAPENFEAMLEGLPDEVGISRRASGIFDVVVVFALDAKELARRLGSLPKRLDPDGALWVAWPKRSSGVPTDLDFHRVQQCGLEAGLVDNKVCAIDEVWSGLRFVYRVTERERLR